MLLTGAERQSSASSCTRKRISHGGQSEKPGACLYTRKRLSLTGAKAWGLPIHAAYFSPIPPHNPLDDVASCICQALGGGGGAGGGGGGGAGQGGGGAMAREQSGGEIGGALEGQRGGAQATR